VFHEMVLTGELPGYELVLAGGPGWRDQRLRLLLEQRSAGENRTDSVKPLGFIDDAKLAHVYSGCEAFVFPSRYEGFGLPVLEARACGARVVATDIPEIREAGGDDVIYIQPTFEGIREGVRRAVTGARASQPSRELLTSWRRSAAIVARYLNDE
jgi:glycosyltransferase involved in cell wall biosynthesis